MNKKKEVSHLGCETSFLIIGLGDSGYAAVS